MIRHGHKWRRSNTVVLLPAVKGQDREFNLRFGRVCQQHATGAIETNYKWPNGNPVFAKPIPHTGWGRTNMMYGKQYVRDGEVRIPAYLCHNARCYTTSWVHEEKTLEYQRKKTQERLDNS